MTAPESLVERLAGVLAEHDEPERTRVAPAERRMRYYRSQARALLPVVEQEIAAARAEAWDGAADDEGEVNAVPTPGQLLRRMANGTAEQRLAWAERALVNAEKAHQCFIQNHRGRVAHLERVLAASRAEALREAADELDHRASGGTAFNAAAQVVRDRATRITRTAAQTPATSPEEGR